jgi:hypothetical protein
VRVVILPNRDYLEGDQVNGHTHTLFFQDGSTTQPRPAELVTPKLDPSRFTVHSVPERLAKLKKDPWQGFSEANQYLPDQLPRRTTPVSPETSSTAPPLPRRSSIIVARPPKPRRG